MRRRWCGTLFGLLAVAGGARAAAAEGFATEAASESLVPVRPGKPGAAPFWNRESRQFVFAPAFDFKVVDGAAGYRFTVPAADGTARTVQAREPWAALSPVWADVPVGTATVRAEGVTDGTVVGVAGERVFHRAAVFNGEYGKAAGGYGESARRALRTVVGEGFVTNWRETGRPDAGYPLYRYASKVIGKVMTACAMYALEEPRHEDRSDVLEIGRRAGDYLISITATQGPLAGMPPTYHGATATERENDAWTMMMTPAEAGEGYLDLYEATGGTKYLEAAGRIADGYARTQLPSGTWHLKVDNRTGEAVARIELIPAEVIEFLDRIVRDHPHAPRAGGADAARDRAVAWVMANPVRTFDWRAQFDDAKVRGAYQNLAKHEACMFAGHLLRRGGQEDVATGEELLRFAEDQFVVWEAPPASSEKFAKAEDWITPASAEQYAMFEPVAGSSAFMIAGYVAAYRATGKEIYLAKAEALGDALARAQARYNGRYPTRLYKSHDRTYWVNSTVNTVRAMKLLAAAVGEKAAK
jgi:hypothetical protein